MAIKITISTLKGGDGKTTLTILLSNNLAARGCKILVVDLDPNNSTTMYYTTGIDDIENICIEKNIFLALTRKDAASNVIGSRKENIDIIPSSLDLSSIRTIDTKTLSKVLSQVDGRYDYIIIDTAPTYDNHTISALYAADLIFTPVAPIKFTLSTTSYLRTKLYDELEEKVPSWYLIYNKSGRDEFYVRSGGTAGRLHEPSVQARVYSSQYRCGEGAVCDGQWKRDLVQVPKKQADGDGRDQKGREIRH